MLLVFYVFEQLLDWNALVHVLELIECFLYFSHLWIIDTKIKHQWHGASHWFFCIHWIFLIFLLELEILLSLYLTEGTWLWFFVLCGCAWIVHHWSYQVLSKQLRETVSFIVLIIVLRWWSLNFSSQTICYQGKVFFEREFFLHRRRNFRNLFPNNQPFLCFRWQYCIIVLFLKFLSRWLRFFIV